MSLGASFFLVQKGGPEVYYPLPPSSHNLPTSLIFWKRSCFSSLSSDSYFSSCGHEEMATPGPGSPGSTRYRSHGALDTGVLGRGCLRGGDKLHVGCAPAVTACHIPRPYWVLAQAGPFTDPVTSTWSSTTRCEGGAQVPCPSTSPCSPCP